MKRIIIAMILVLGFQFSQAQTVRTLFNEFRGEENATCVKVSWLPIRLLGLFVDDEAGQIVKRISSIRVLEVSDCSREVQERLASKLQTLKMDDYEPLIAVKDEGSHVRMWGKMKDDTIKELVIGVSGDGDAVLCHIKGKLSLDDLNFSMENNNVTLLSGK